MTTTFDQAVARISMKKLYQKLILVSFFYADFMEVNWKFMWQSDGKALTIYMKLRQDVPVHLIIITTQFSTLQQCSDLYVEVQIPLNSPSPIQ